MSLKRNQGIKKPRVVQCLYCKRQIGLTLSGNFRRHMSSKGVVCAGAWLFPHQQKERFEKLPALP